MEGTSSSLPLTINNLLLTFKEFFIVWINQILYYNKIYNQLTFDKFKSFELIIYKNRNPLIQQYLNDLIINIINNLIVSQSNGLNEINCIIYNTNTNQIKSKYLIKFHNFIINLQQTINNLDDIANDQSSKLNIEGIDWQEIYTQFNSILFHHIQQLKQLNIDDNRDDTNFFKILVDLDEQINPTTSNWVRLQQQQTVESYDQPIEKKDYIPIGNVDLQIINFDLYNEIF
ncbi:uncharacterized protein J8A68_004809 [[Candida] subhashii]|uniref:HORMA domain-containing protein n=1 Tax=[Candida] subhashii TaxID=561895 RepID=A0A8J5Q9V1_9ASCO|nr:uncharacterized protein J8A68_004809 [[Candida] subhashii]KAG7661656.1 hypothetical protein J8A68_004809 [[Candida] subhashii]